MMDREYIDRHLLADRYLQGGLTESEQAEFEERLVWDQELLDELDIAERLREGLKLSVEEGRYSIGDTGASMFGRLSEWFAVPQYAAAASFLLAIALTASVFMSPLMPGDEHGGGQLATTEVVPLLVLRGSDAPMVQINQNAWTVLLIDVVGSFDSYRITVRIDEAGSAPFWEQDKMLPTYPDSLAVGMPGNLLSPGRYLLRVEGAQDSEADEAIYEHVQDIPFITAFADQ